MTLLEKAKLIKHDPKSRPAASPDEAEVMIAWIMREIDTTQLASALGVSNTQTVISRIGPALRHMASRGLLKIELKKPTE